MEGQLRKKIQELEVLLEADYGLSILKVFRQTEFLFDLEVTQFRSHAVLYERTSVLDLKTGQLVPAYKIPDDN